VTPARGQRWIDGKLYLLAGRFVGFDAREQAAEEAKIVRARGKLARIVKINSVAYFLFTF
jgi:hypothetical protein